MRVLIVSEQFKKGGLEVHIAKQIEALKDDVEFVFAFGVYEPAEKLTGVRIHQIDSFHVDYTVQSFINQVNALVEIIHEDDIDVIHVHPFLSLMPALFASVLTGKPIVYTIHGALSISGHSQKFAFSFLQRYFLSHMNPTVITVRTDFNDSLLHEYGVKKIEYIPNTVTPQEYHGLKPVKNGHWALLSRLDDEARDALFLIINNIDELGIKQLDIYGIGLHEDRLKKHIAQKKLSKKVKLQGWTNGLVGALKQDDYEGVIGHGQVALEGMSAGYPVLLLSYGRLSGLITKELYEEVKTKNFVNIYLAARPISEMASELAVYRKHPQKYNLQETVLKEFHNTKVQKQYLEALVSARYTHSLQIEELWKELLKATTEEDSSLSSELVLASDSFNELIERNFAKYGFTVSPLLLEQLKNNTHMRTQERLMQQIKHQNTTINNNQVELLKLMNVKMSARRLVGNIMRKITERK